ncbi:MAG TPA: hypothetical protein VNR17_07525 [Luteimicrobium sp.]|jgi:hypothetical protein|nr:hypothetical protein [Luteimicrobium sp.]
MTTTPNDDYDTAGLVSGRDGFTGEDDGATPGPGPRGEDLDETPEEIAKRKKSVLEQEVRTPGPGPDGADLGEPAEEIGEARREHIAKHAADHGRTPGPGPDDDVVDPRDDREV